MNADDNEFVINIKNLTKKYKLYKNPNDRLWDILGFKRNRIDLYSEHLALDNISLQIKKGERVGIVGRNGAGKSTLLKLISGVIKPSEGEIKVTGLARALLQIGTGFHMDLTGRENAQAYLIQMGMNEKKLDSTIDEIIEFSELEEYIDQPVKAYSTGMVARLMFATSTAITPDLLILDEILSVGDAYFSKKCMEKIQEICSRENSTMLLVSHDVYSAAKLVDRMIWIDKGRIIADADPATILKYYEDSIRMQEELRLRKKTLVKIEKKLVKKNNEDDILIFEIASQNNIPQKSIIYFSKIALLESETIIGEIPLQEEIENQPCGLVSDGTALGSLTLFNEHLTWPMLNYGTVQHKIVFYFLVPDVQKKIDQNKLSLQLEYYTQTEGHLVLNCFQGERPVYSMPILLTATQWYLENFFFTEGGTTHVPTINATGRFGSGAMHITDVNLLNKDNDSILVVNFGDYSQIHLTYEICKPDFNGKADIIVIILKNGVETACRFFTREIDFKAHESLTGVIKLEIERFTLGAGEYSIAVLIAEEGYMDKTGLVFYTLNPSVYFCGRDLYHFRVKGGGSLAEGTPYVAEGKWEQILTLSS